MGALERALRIIEDREFTRVQDHNASFMACGECRAHETTGKYHKEGCEVGELLKRPVMSIPENVQCITFKTLCSTSTVADYFAESVRKSVREKMGVD